MSKKRPGPLLKLNNHEDKPHDEHDHEKEKKIPDRIIQVAPKLYLSGAKAASNFEELLQNQINVIVSLIPTKNMKVYPETFQYIDSPISDHVDQDISHLIIELPMKIHDLVQQGKHVLVHCQEVGSDQQGISRAPSILIAYLMFQNGRDFDHNLSHIRAHSPKVDPNISFITHLNNLYETVIVKGAHSHKLRETEISEKS